MLEIKCPNCNEISKLFLLDARYNDPFRCWKCKAAFMVEIEGNEVKSALPMSQEDFNRWQELQQLKKTNR
jgi:hypothetical protein